MEKIKKIAYTVSAAAMAAPTIAFGALGNNPGFSGGFGELKNGTGLESSSNVGDIIAQVINWMLYFIGFISVIFIIIAGIKYITSAGDDDQVTSAKKTLIYAVVGLLVALLGLVLVNTVVQMSGAGVVTS